MTRPEDSGWRVVGRWLRRLIVASLIVTAVAMWLDMNHVRPWAYLPVGESPEPNSKLLQPISGDFSAGSSLKLVQELAAEHDVELRIAVDLQTQWKQANQAAITLRAHRAPLQAVLAAAASSLDVRFEREGDVFEVMTKYTALSPTPEVHSLLGALAEGVSETPSNDSLWRLEDSLEPITAASPFLTSGPVAGGFGRFAYIETQVSNTGLSSNGVPPQRFGAVALQLEEERRHETYRRLEQATIARSVYGPQRLQSLEASAIGARNAQAFEQKKDYTFRETRVEDAIKQVLGDDIPWVFQTPGHPAYRRSISLHLKNASRISALRLVLLQCGLHLGIHERTVVITPIINTLQERDVAWVHVAELLAPDQRYATEMIGNEASARRIGEAMLVSGSWEKLRKLDAQILAGREARSLDRIGDYVFVGTRQERRIKRHLAAPAQPLGQPQTSGELAAALREVYDINVVLHPAHLDKQLVPGVGEHSSQTLHDAIIGRLPKAEGPLLTVDHDALIISFAGAQRPPVPVAVWMKIPRCFDDSLGEFCERVVGRPVSYRGMLWGESFVAHPAAGVAAVRVDYADLQPLQTLLRVVAQPPTSKPVRLMGEQFVLKAAVPKSLARLPNLEPEDWLAVEEHESDGPWIVSTEDGVVVVGSEERLAGWQELLERWDASRPPKAGEGGWKNRITRHRAALEMFSRYRDDVTSAELKQFANLVFNGQLREDAWQRMLLDLIDERQVAPPDLMAVIRQGFAGIVSPHQRARVIELMLAHRSNQGDLHEMMRHMSPSDFGTLQQGLESMTPARKQDWLPVMLRLYDQHPPSRNRIGPIIEQMQSELPSMLNVVPNAALPGMRGPTP